jgi:plasmid maintenance system killer protein
MPPPPGVAAPRPKPSRLVGTSFLILFGTAGAICLGVWIGRQFVLSTVQVTIGWVFATFVFGALVGLSEILSRYRDEPMLATATASGMSYLAFNGAISAVAFGVLRKYPEKILPVLNNDLCLTAVAAGFGAMVIFRSKLFTFKSSDGNEYPIGPAIALDTILKMIDSQIDRRRATERQKRVFDSMFAIHDFARAADYMEASLLSFQNLSPDDKKQISTTIDQYRTTTKWPDTLKGLGLGFAFLSIAGEDNFDVVVANLRQYVASQASATPPPTAIPPDTPQ